MKAISVWQPWANWIAQGYKTIETRMHDRFKNLAGHTIAIHAAQKIDSFAWKIAKDYAPEKIISIYTHGAIVCTAHVVKHRILYPKDSTNACMPVVFPWEYSRHTGVCRILLYGLILEDIKQTKPFKINGRQGIFHVPDEVIEYV